MENQTFAPPTAQVQTPVMQNNLGGYPYGYPPVIPQAGQSPYSPFISPFPSPQPMVPIMPGVNTPMELEDKNGNKMTIPPSNVYNQGGATISQGGFNPVNGMVSAPVAGSGYNPYAQFIGNAGYTVPGQGTGFVGQPPQQGFSPYIPQPRPMGYNNYYNPLFYCGYGGQNQFDQNLQELLYNSEPSIVDTKEMLEQVILTEEEREKINHRGFIVGYDYYGNPVYNNNAYYANQQRQNQFEEARLAYQKHFTMISKIAHAYSGETINEDAVMKRFDPVPPQQASNNKKVFNYYNATPEEIEQYEKEARIQATEDLQMRVEQYDYNQQLLKQQKELAMQQIKISHDKLIGVEPGEHYDLKTFMDNGYKIGVNIAMQQAKSANRNGTNKYSRNGFRANLSQQTNTAVPITSKDDEYVSIEQILKNVYDRNKRTDAILKTSSGQTTYTSAPVFNSEFESHQYFLEEMQKKKDQDDVRKAVM